MTPGRDPVRGASYLPALDGLRALAVVAVVAFHLGRLDGGFLGVDLFFVLSGFLITRLLLAERDRSGRVDLRAFWGRRARRLLPLLLVVVPLVMVGSRLWLASWRLPSIGGDALAALAYVANWRFVLAGQSYFAAGVDPSPLRHTWSLAVEEQFYLLWPVLVIALVRLAPRAPRLAVGVGSAALTVVGAVLMAWAARSGHDLTRVYYGTDTRLFALTLGAAVASGWDAARTRLARSSRAVPLVTGAAAVSLVGLAGLFAFGREDEPGFYQGGFQAAAALSIVAIASVATGEGPIAAVLSSRGPTWIGRRAYGIYLWSWPIQMFVLARFPDASRAATDTAIVAASVAAAAASFRWLERPVIEGRRPGGTGAPLVHGPRLLAGGVAAVVAVVLLASIGAPAPPRLLATSDADVRDQALADGGFAPLPPDDPPRVADPSSAAPGVGRRTPADRAAPHADEAGTIDPGPNPPLDVAAPLVVTGRSDPGTVFGRPLRVLIVGDSVGWSLGANIEGQVDVAVDISNRALIGCGVLPVDARWIGSIAGTQPYPEICAVQAEAEALGMASDPDVVLLWLGAWEVFDQEVDGVRHRVGTSDYATLLEARLQARIDAARAVGAPTVMPLVPCFDGALAAEFRPERLDPARIAAVNRSVRAVATRNPGWVRLIDPAAVLCDAAGSSLGVDEDGDVVREDGAHFDTSAPWMWNTFLGGALGAVFGST